MENTLNFLKEATLIKNYNVIKHILENFDINKKGTLLEKYLCFLYNGNGYIAKHIGGKGDGGTDILLYHPSNLNLPMFIIQSKNHQRPLSFDDARSELIKFEEVSKVKYKCKNYILLSINGFVSDCDKLKRTNMKFESWNYICNLIDNYDNKKRSFKIDLFAHNYNSYKDVCRYLTNSNKAAVIQATGTGKSYIIMQIMLDYNNCDKIIIAPSTLILNQLKNKYVGRIDNVIFLTYSKLSKMNDIDFNGLSPKLVVFDELHRLGAPIWCNGYKLIERLFPEAKLVGFSATPIRFLDSQRNMVDELFLGNSTDELSLTDAIVRDILPMPKYISSLYTLDEEINNRKDRINSSNLNDDEKNKALTTLDGIALNWEKTNGVDGILKKHISDTADNLKFMVFCEDQNHLNSMEHVVFSWFKKAFKNKRVKLYTITSKTLNNKEEEALFVNNKSKNTIDILLSINMYNEGIHISGITGILMLRKTQSNIIYYQQIGRAMDVNSINPIIFDLVNNFDNFSSLNFMNSLTESYNKEKEYREQLELPLSDDSIFVQINDYISNSLDVFKDIDSIIRPMWEYMYNELIEYKKANGHCNVPFRGNKLGSWVGSQRKAFKMGKLTKEQVLLLNKIGFDWNPKLSYWFERYNELIEYKKANGHCNVPFRESELGIWVGSQRKAFKKDSLTNEQVDLLNEIGFVWDAKESAWDIMFNELINYKTLNGHCNFEKSESNSGNDKLANWVNRQRQEFKKGVLDSAKIDLLEGIGFVWDFKSFYWHKQYNNLIEYKNINGHCNVRFSDEELGSWVRTQRKSFKKGSLNKYRIDLLNDIGFVWEIASTQWMEMYNSLIEYKNIYGHCNVERKICKDDYSQLANWVQTQRNIFKTKGMDPKKVNLLEQVGFIWDVKQNQWNKKYLELVEYKNFNEHCNVPVDDGELGIWVKNQRISYRKGLIDNERVNLLDKIGFNWDPILNQWEDKYNELIAFKNSTGHLNVTQKDGNIYNWAYRQKTLYAENKLSHDRVRKLTEIGFDLSIKSLDWDIIIDFYKNPDSIPYKYKREFSRWIDSQRKSYKRKLLSYDKISQLNQIGFDWSEDDFIWNTMFDSLCKYRRTNGNCLVPFDYNELGKWVSTQRRLYSRNKLPIDKINKLESIEFIWDVVQHQWDSNYNDLVKYYLKNSSFNISKDMQKLSSWCYNQRANYKNGTLSEDNVNKLNNIGFPWIIRYETSWKDMYDELTEYKKANGHCNVPFRGNKLGSWVGSQRKAFKMGKLTKEQVLLLNKIGFDWNPKLSYWFERYNELIEYKKANGHCNVPFRESELGIWIGSQRKAFKKDSLTNEQIDLLNKIGFIWDIEAYMWEQMFNKLKELKNSRGNVNITAKDGYVFQWFNKQKKMCTKNKLSTARLQKLIEIGFLSENDL